MGEERRSQAAMNSQPPMTPKLAAPDWRNTKQDPSDERNREFYRRVSRAPRPSLSMLTWGLPKGQR